MLLYALELQLAPLGRVPGGHALTQVRRSPSNEAAASQPHHARLIDFNRRYNGAKMGLIGAGHGNFLSLSKLS